MSYTISISGHVTATDDAAAQAVEQTIRDSFAAVIASLPEGAGVATAAGSFQHLGSVSLLPAPPAPELPTLAEALATLAAANITPGEDGTLTLSAEQAAALGSAILAVEAAGQAVEAAVRPDAVAL